MGWNVRERIRRSLLIFSQTERSPDSRLARPLHTAFCIWLQWSTWTLCSTPAQRPSPPQNTPSPAHTQLTASAPAAQTSRVLFVPLTPESVLLHIFVTLTPSIPLLTTQTTLLCIWIPSTPPPMLPMPPLPLVAWLSPLAMTSTSLQPTFVSLPPPAPLIVPNKFSSRLGAFSSFFKSHLIFSQAHRKLRPLSRRKCPQAGALLLLPPRVRQLQHPPHQHRYPRQGHPSLFPNHQDPPSWRQRQQQISLQVSPLFSSSSLCWLQIL